MDQILDIGARVECEDGPAGAITCVIVDPVARKVTHLVVEPEHSPGQGRLVPIDVVAGTDGPVLLRCAAREFAEFEFAEETHFISPDGEDLGYGEGEIMTWPYYGIGLDMGASEIPNSPRSYFESRVPVGEVEVRRGERLHAADGDFGRVHGFVVDPADHRITHLVIEEGHVFSRREVTLPIRAVTKVDEEGVTVALRRDELRALPKLELDA